MKAAQINSFGGSDVISLADKSLPEISKDEALVRIHAAGVNPIDFKVREGYAKGSVSPPLTLGTDFSGAIEKVAKNGTFKVGDEVYGQAGVLGKGSGSFAQRAIVPLTSMWHKPKNITHEQAAALPLVGVSAYQALVDHANVQKGQRVLIHGGAGGIGSIAIQIARSLECYVITTVSTSDVQFARELGAHEAIDYKTQDFSEIVKDIDVVLDTVGGETYRKSFKVVKKGGTIVSMLEQPDTDLMQKYGVKAIAQSTKSTPDRLAQIEKLVERGAIAVPVDKTFPLESTAEALDYLENDSPRGKVVVTM